MPYSVTSGLDVVTHLTGRVGGNSTFWNAQEKRDAFNEALSCWNCMTGEFTTSFSLPVTGDTYYNVPRQIASVQRVSYNGAGLMSTSIEALDMAQPGWQNDAAATPREWAPVGLTIVAVHPAPTTGTFLFEGIAETPHLLNDGDKMDAGDEFLDALLSYGHHYLSFKDGGAEFQASEAGMEKLIDAATGRNSRFIAVSTLMRIMGRDTGEQLKKPRSPIKTVGARRA